MAKGKQKGSRRAARRRGQVQWFVAIAGAVALAGVGLYWLWPQVWQQPGQFFPSLGNLHLATADTPHIAYNTDPPTSGPHLPYIAPWGIHTVPIPKELQVHNLEDGGVLVQYNCECPDLVAKLRPIVERYKDHVVLAPYPPMKPKIALTAWSRIDAFDAFDERRIVRFIEAYRGIDHHAR